MNMQNGSSSSFFEQMRKLGIVRQDSQWFGGVAAGLAQRFSIDTILVRGIIIVLSIFAGVGLIAYALAWALLPDRHGTIHLEQAIAKEWTNGMTGAVIFFVCGLLPLPWAIGSLGPILFPVVIIAGVLFLIFSRRNTRFARHHPAPPSPGSASSDATAHRSGPVHHGTVIEKPWRVPHDPAFHQRQSKEFPEVPGEPKLPEPEFEQHPHREDQMSTPYNDGFTPPPPHHSPTPQVRKAPPIPGWVATIVVGLSVLSMAAVLLAGQLDFPGVPDNGWTLALPVGLLVAGLGITFASFAKRTSGGLLGLAIPLLVLTLIFGGKPVIFGDYRDGVIVHDDPNEYSAVFSNATIDLTGYRHITTPTKVEINSVFSKVDLVLPEGVPVTIDSNGVFMSKREGVDSLNHGIDDPTAPVLTVEFNGVFTNFDYERSNIITGPETDF